MEENYIRKDDLMRNNLHLYQDTRGFCFGTDAVLISSFANIKKNSVVLDVGSSSGIIPLLVSARYEPLKIYGIEILENQFDLFLKNVSENNLSHIIEPVFGDFNEKIDYFKTLGINHIISNPPYKKADSGIINPESDLAVARHEIKLSLKELIGGACKILPYGGKLSIINRPERLCDIMCLMRENKMEPKRLRMVVPKEGKAPTMVMVEGAKGERPFLKVEESLVIYNSDGTYTDEINKIYTE